MAAAPKTKRSVLMTQLLMLLLLVFATSSSAQTQSNVLLQGRITDRSTGLPIVGAKVTLYSWQLVTVQTDGNGMYSITTQQFSSTGTAGFGVTAPGYFAIAFEVNIAGPFPDGFGWEFSSRRNAPEGHRYRLDHELADCKCCADRFYIQPI